MPLRHRSLRLQLGLVLAGVAAVSVGIVGLGAFAYVGWGEWRFHDTLSPAAREAYEATWAVSGMPSPDIVREISLAEEEILHPVYTTLLQVTLMLSVLAVVASLPIAWWTARRLTSPLETAAHAARVIATGEFDHRIEAPPGSSAEVVSLVQSFTHLAESLERMEHDVRFHSAAIAHEIRTPLTVIRGYLQGIRDGVFEADEERLTSMLERIEALGALLGDLQTLSLAESGRLTLAPTPTLLGERLSKLVDWLGARRDGTVVSLHRDATEPTVDVDVERIEQVVLELIENARRYAGEAAEIRLRTVHREDAVEIVVDDDGPGFSDRALQHARERFWRDESSRSRETGGTGLGLAVARAVAEAHGGALRLMNRPEGGASVRVIVPTRGQRVA